MPDKKHRVASHQAQVSSRRHRHKGPSGIPTVASSGQPDKVEERISPEQAQPSVAHRAPALRPSREADPLVHRYIGPELRRIAAIGGGVMVILIVLSIVVG